MGYLEGKRETQSMAFSPLGWLIVLFVTLLVAENRLGSDITPAIAVVVVKIAGDI